MNAKSERASLPDRVEAAAPKRISTGQCYNCGWTRAAMLYDDRIVFSAWHSGLAGVSEPNKCYECRTWSSMRALAAADACEAERNPNTDRELPHKFPPNAPDEVIAWRCAACGEWSDIHQEFDGPCPIDWRRPVSSEDVHREAAE